MKLNAENYFSPKAMHEYLSVSQFKAFVGSPFKEGCPASAMAELKGEYVKPKSDALLLGSYVDCMLTEPEKYESFVSDHPEMFSSRGATKGELKSTFQRGIQMVERVKRDEFAMKTLNGKKQVIMTGDLYGAKWKIKLDVLGDKFITDLKTCESITKSYYDKTNSRWVSFVEYYDYVLQAGIYQKIVEQNIGKKLPFFLLAVSKEPTTDIEVIQIDNQSIEERLEGIENYVSLVRAYKNGEIEPSRCEHCDYCKETKILSKPINYLELGGVFD